MRLWTIGLICLVVAGISCVEEKAIVHSKEDLNNEDLGVVFEGRREERFFRYVNKTDDVMRIDKVGTSCRCMKADFVPKVLGPRRAGFLKIELTPEPGSAGDILPSVLMYANDVILVRLQFRAFVALEADVEGLQ